METEDRIARFHPLVGDWFRSRFPAATPVQEGVWDSLARGEHVLAEAPTGNGKTLAAFLHAISALVSGELPAEGLSVLYISPLKALNEDIRRNLEDPLEGIAALAASRGQAIPQIRVESRSGDTSEAARRRFLRKPPAILCTTPESLAILLDSARARPLLSTVRLLVLDEIHAVAGNKRGALLACCLGRLALLAGEFRRIALSATLRPAEPIAEWFGGLMLVGKPGEAPLLRRRPVTIVAPRIGKELEFSVEWPEAPVSVGTADEDRDASRYSALVPAFRKRIEANRTSLIFCDARRRAERLAFLINGGGLPRSATAEEPEAGLQVPAEGGLAFAHHGSLSRELRELVESRLKAGELRCVVATSSLELGIDIGSIDEVLLAGSPPAISSAVQRAGRSGHGVGLRSRVALFPFHGLDLLAAGAIVREARKGVIEELRPPRNPLDVLAQVLLSLAAEEERSIEALFDIVRSFAPFENLPRSLFDCSLAMLAGRWASSRLRELEVRVHLDAASGRAVAARGALQLLHSSGGTIPDRGLYSMRLQGEGKRIGELDEEFVWERKVGDSFTLGTQAWRIVDIGAEAVTVRPLERAADFIPFWKGGPNYASPELSAGLLSLIGAIAGASPARIGELLESECRFSPSATATLLSFIERQRQAQGRVALPGPESIVVELVEAGRRTGGTTMVVHTLRGGRINEGLALVLTAAFLRDGYPAPQAMADDEGVLLLLPDSLGGVEELERIIAILRGLGDRRVVEELLRSRLESSGLFAASFRENAGRALLLPRGFPGKRVPLFITRLRAARLFEAVKGSDDFPVTIETWRSLLADTLDVEGLVSLLSALASGSLGLGCFRSQSPSPFASGARWAETNEYLYRGDDLGGARSSVSGAAIDAALDASRLRPRLDPDLVEAYVRRKKRMIEGWSPEDPRELAEWVRERVAIPADEVASLVGIGGFAAAWDEDPTVGGRLVVHRLPGASEELVVHAELAGALVRDPASLLAEWLRFEGPLPLARLTELFGWDAATAEGIVVGLEAEDLVVRDLFLRGSDLPLVIDRNNCDALLRMGRRAARPQVEARPPEELFALVARVQGLGSPRPSGPGAVDAATAALERLAGYPAPLSIWVSAILPARLGPDPIHAVDEALAKEGWLWFGGGATTLAFANAWNYELFASERLGASGLIPEVSEALDFWAIRQRSGLAVRDCAEAIWKEAWAGRIGSDSLSSVIKGLGNRFGRDLPQALSDADDPAGKPRFARGARLPPAVARRWRGGAPVEGLWSSLRLEGEALDALDVEELDRERVRVLQRRYGVILRPLLDRELGVLSWKRLFPCLRRMELAGELLSGHFFRGVPAPQFMSPEAFELFMKLDPPAGQGPLWLSALDPASPAGFPFDERSEAVPARLATTLICLEGGRVIAHAKRSGKELLLEPGLEAGKVQAILELWSDLVGKVILETIDGRAATDSPWTSLLIEAGFERDRGRLRRW